eukprot:tig00020710_g13251.t1
MKFTYSASTPLAVRSEQLTLACDWEPLRFGAARTRGVSARPAGDASKSLILCDSVVDLPDKELDCDCNGLAECDCRPTGSVKNALAKTTPSRAAAGSTAKLASVGSGHKMVILVRADLGMGCGKACAQSAHAAVAAYKAAPKGALRAWESEGGAKIVLRVNSEQEMLDLQRRAGSAGLTSAVISDAGRTQVASGTRTVCAIGPGPVHVVDSVTGHLRLY